MPKFQIAIQPAAAGVLIVTALLTGCSAMAPTDMSRRADADIEMARQRQSEEKTEITNPSTYLSLIRRMQEQGLYYASLALMQLQGEAWGKWNPKMQQVLLGLQKPDGSWDPKGRLQNKGGRIYTTAMSTLTLEVYYRYLPMYGRKIEDRNKDK